MRFGIGRTAPFLPSMRHSLFFPLGLLAVGIVHPAFADVTLPPVIADQMVLQRDSVVPIWGKADPGEKVTVEFAGQSHAATADASGKWMVRLTPLKANADPAQMLIRGKNRITLSDVLVGEVWLASGQSNMAFPLGSAHNSAEELPSAGDPLLRFLTVKAATSPEPLAESVASWKASDPNTAKGFSAVAYFFAKELRKTLGCPVGILHASWGGTGARSWTSIEALKKEPAFTTHIRGWEDALQAHREVLQHPQRVEDYKTALKKWQLEVEPAFKEALKAHAAAGGTGPKPVPSVPEPKNPDPTGMPSPGARPNVAAIIFNAMIHPLIPYAIRGTIWYQGEANASQALEYRTLLPRLIGDWRERWGSDFPFLIVQLANWDFEPTKPEWEHQYPLLREAQAMALSLPKTGLATAIDIGNPKDVHPRNKRDVGMRLALTARRVAYGESLVSSGPVYKEHTIRGGEVRVRFTDTGGGLVIGKAPWLAEGATPVPQDELLGFIIRGDQGKWVPAKARIDGDSVIVSSPEVPAPKAIRYAWANSPRCNLYNQEGLPALPFRTDID
ncbi:MAG: hypothetical protein RLZZ253_2598 [Verrucomicrobiota bacterium]